MKPSVKNAVLIGKVGVDTNGYPCIRLSREDTLLFEKNTEYSMLVLGAVDRKRTVRENMRIIQKSDY